MSAPRFEPLDPAREADWAALLAEPDVAAQFEALDSPGGRANLFADPFADPALRWLAVVDGRPVGFSIGYVIPGVDERWAFVRIGVAGAHRRRGVARALHAWMVDRLRAAPLFADVRTLATGLWHPSPPAEALAAALGYTHERWYWRMTHADDAPAPAWPDGITLTTYVHDEATLLALHETALESFADHHRHIHQGLEESRRLVAMPGFRPDGTGLAWRDGRCVGFCRCTCENGRGEIAALGVIRAARGIGLGRALLRWGTRWLASQPVNRIQLLVDGENDAALRLYRSEGWQVLQTREMLSRPMP